MLLGMTPSITSLHFSKDQYIPVGFENPYTEQLLADLSLIGMSLRALAEQQH